MESAFSYFNKQNNTQVQNVLVTKKGENNISAELTKKKKKHKKKKSGESISPNPIPIPTPGLNDIPSKKKKKRRKKKNNLLTNQTSPDPGSVANVKNGSVKLPQKRASSDLSATPAKILRLEAGSTTTPVARQLIKKTVTFEDTSDVHSKQLKPSTPTVKKSDSCSHKDSALRLQPGGKIDFPKMQGQQQTTAPSRNVTSPNNKFNVDQGKKKAVNSPAALQKKPGQQVQKQEITVPSKSSKTADVANSKEKQTVKLKSPVRVDDLSDSDEETDGLSSDSPPINPLEAAEEILKEILHPIAIDDFFSNYFEKKPLHVKRNDKDYYADWFSSFDLDRVLFQEKVMFSEHLDVTSYEDGVRETHNPEGRAYCAVVWDFYNTGCSIRMLCPQAFHQPLRAKLNLLQEYFGSFVGSNIYLTPPGTQGFAPHYDDIEAFVLQLEGSKHWRVYNPRNEGEQLPRVSSKNFTQDEIGQPVLETTLHPGDLLYFPRGFIHQANALPDNHSLHITVSTYQKNSWGDLLKTLLPLAVEQAMRNDVEYRRGLPIGYLRHMGLAMERSHNVVGRSGAQAETRGLVQSQVKKLIGRLLDAHLPVDMACDQMGKALVHDSLYPALVDNEAANHVTEQGEHWDPKRQCVTNVVELTPDTRIRLARWSAVRVETVDGVTDGVGAVDAGGSRMACRVYHAMHNSDFYHQVEPKYLDITAEALPALELLIAKYPQFVAIEEFPLESDDEKMAVATTLYEIGLVITGEQLEPAWDDDDETGTSDEEGSDDI